MIKISSKYQISGERYGIGNPSMRMICMSNSKKNSPCGFTNKVPQCKKHIEIPAVFTNAKTKIKFAIQHRKLFKK